MPELNRIYNMDCLAGMKQIPDQSINLNFTDLPYGITDCDWDNKINLFEFWKQNNRIMKPNGATLLTGTMKFAIELINSNPRNFRYDWVWDKTMSTGFASSHRMPLRAHEFILVFYRRLPTYNPQGLIEIQNPIAHVKPVLNGKESVYDKATPCKPYTQTHTNYPKDILKFGNRNNGNLHPTQKPLELAKYLIETYTNEGDTVLDCCMGSGTTAVAALQTGRNFIGFETDERYHRVACERINKL